MCTRDSETGKVAQMLRTFTCVVERGGAAAKGRAGLCVSSSHWYKASVKEHENDHHCVYC
jgi:hypothetical protein